MKASFFLRNAKIYQNPVKFSHSKTNVLVDRGCGKGLFCTLFSSLLLLQKDHHLLLLQQQEEEEGKRSFQFFYYAKHCSS